MIDVILTTLSVIATGAGALVAMWLVVSVLYTLGCVMFGWEKPPRFLARIGRVRARSNPTRPWGPGARVAGSSVVGCQMPRASAGRFTQLDL